MPTKIKAEVVDGILGQDEIKELLEIAAHSDLPTLLVGDTGTGKTSLIRELASQHGRTYSRFSITGETTVDDFVGKYILKDGETLWQDGILLTAVKRGHYLVVDEVNAALPEILFVLHSLLDDDKYVTVPQQDNRIVKPHPNFRFFATMNPVDEYAGTKELNKAFLSRFAMVISVQYPKRDIEVRILSERTDVGLEQAVKMVDVAVGVRQAKEQEKVFYTFSTRDLIYWGKLVSALGIHRAFRVAIKNKGESDGKVLEEIYNQVFTDYKKAEEEGWVTSIEEIKNLNAELTKSRADLITQIRGIVEQDLDYKIRELKRLHQAVADGTYEAKKEAKGVQRLMELEALSQIINRGKIGIEFDSKAIRALEKPPKAKRVKTTPKKLPQKQQPKAIKKSNAAKH